LLSALKLFLCCQGQTLLLLLLLLLVLMVLRLVLCLRLWGRGG